MTQTAMEYKKAFLKSNKLTVKTFERIYVKFMERQPDEQAYRDFADEFGITIHEGLGNSETEAALSVNIAVIKVLSNSNFEAKAHLMSIMKDI